MVARRRAFPPQSPRRRIAALLADSGLDVVADEGRRGRPERTKRGSSLAAWEGGDPALTIACTGCNAPAHEPCRRSAGGNERVCECRDEAANVVSPPPGEAEPFGQAAEWSCLPQGPAMLED
uniref:hypothetical protein n=1 Tax=Gluconobacter thailandicus TaxID=257438 RepID=UPI0012E80786|nr:hypothetical protein [Gluconobacter thailandicus]